jgi:solute carrier family 25 carnitine/acylcarnitine transporter 20/29
MKGPKLLSYFFAVLVALSCFTKTASACDDWIDEAVAGFIGGAAGVGGGQPLDTVRIRMQTGLAEGTALQTAVRMAKKEGVASFWRGSIPPVVGTGLQNAILFGTYYPALKILGKEDLASMILAGAVGGTAQAFVCTPLELLKTREQIRVGPPSWRDTLAVAKQVRAVEGSRGLYRGLTCTVIRDAPSYGLYFYAYKRATELLDKMQVYPWMTTFIGGGIAGMVAWASIYPIDVAKSKIQASTSSHPDDRSALRVLRKTYATGGRAALFHGFGVTMLRAFVLNGFTFVGFETATKALGYLRSRHT